MKFASELRTLDCCVLWQPAILQGAAAQRNQGIGLASYPILGFFDDDILFEPNCISRLLRALESDATLGGVSAMITNQRYLPPGRISRWMFWLMAGRSETSYAGRVLGPAVNLLPEDRGDLPEVVTVEWLNLGCTLYRREALPDCCFASHFKGYSMMEDLALSLTVGRRWLLANARTARIYHDSQPGIHKDEPVATSRMELVNRHYIMTGVMKRCRVRDYTKLVLWEFFQLAICAIKKRGGFGFWQELRGKLLGVYDILNRRTKPGFL
jgi:GT2 family glycosyltransferase